MKLGTILLICILAFVIYNGKNIKKIYLNTLILSMVISLMIERGYFIKLGSFQLTYGNFCDLFLFFISTIYLLSGKKVVYKKQFIAWIVCFFFLGFSWLMLILDPTQAMGANFDVAWDDILVNNYPLQRITFTSSMVTTVLQIILFMFISFIAYTKLKKEDWIYLLKKVVKFSRYIFIINLVELVTKYFLHSNVYDQFTNQILGVTKSTYSEIVLRGSGIGLNGLTKEPSHYAFAIVVLFILNYAFLLLPAIPKREIEKTKIIMVFMIIELCMMMSFSVLYFGLMLLIIIGIRKFYISFGATGLIVFAFLLIVLIVVVGLYNTVFINKLSTAGFWGRRILSLEQEVDLVSTHQWLSVAAPNALEWSNRVRLGSTYETLLLFRYRPLIGLGLGSVTAHSSLAMLLTGGGIFGTLSFLNIFFWLRNCNIVNFKKILFYLFGLIYCLMTLFSSLSFNPFIDTWTMLLVFSLLVLSNISSEDNFENSSSFKF